MDASPPIAPPSPARRLLVVAPRLVAVHFAAYPVAFLWAVAAIPLTIHLSARILDDLGDLDRIGRFVVGRLLWPAGAAFALAHVTAVPWMVARDPKRGLRGTLMALGALLAVGVLAGAASWLWLVLR